MKKETLKLAISIQNLINDFEKIKDNNLFITTVKSDPQSLRGFHLEMIEIYKNSYKEKVEGTINLLALLIDNLDDGTQQEVSENFKEIEDGLIYAQVENGVIKRPKPMPKKQENECPHGHIFGKDTEDYDECDKCKVWEACIAIKEGKEE